MTAAESGFTLTWDRSVPPLSLSQPAQLELQTGGHKTVVVLDRASGTMVIPYAPDTAVITAGGSRFPLIKSAPVIEPAPAAPRASERRTVDGPTVRVPMVVSNRSQRLVSTARVVLPKAPSFVHRMHQVDLKVKVSPSGEVVSVASGYASDPLRNKLGAISSDAVSKWRFNAMTIRSYREGVVRLVFTPGRVRVEPRSSI